jgi:hypothetical protein
MGDHFSISGPGIDRRKGINRVPLRRLTLPHFHRTVEHCQDEFPEIALVRRARALIARAKGANHFVSIEGSDSPRIKAP